MENRSEAEEADELQGGRDRGCRENHSKTLAFLWVRWESFEGFEQSSDKV